MNKTIPQLMKELIKKENDMDKLDEQIKELKKRKVDTKQQVSELEKLKNEIESLWNLIINRIPDFILGNNQKEMIESAQIFGKRFYDGGLTTSQIRNVYGEVKKIQMKSTLVTEKQSFLLSLRMLLPKLAYAAARAKKQGTNELKDVLNKGLETVLEENIKPEEAQIRFENFANFFEAILAYHKESGGN